MSRELRQSYTSYFLLTSVCSIDCSLIRTPRGIRTVLSRRFIETVICGFILGIKEGSTWISNESFIELENCSVLSLVEITAEVERWRTTSVVVFEDVKGGNSGSVSRLREMRQYWLKRVDLLIFTLRIVQSMIHGIAEVFTIDYLVVITFVNCWPGNGVLIYVQVEVQLVWSYST